MKSDIAFHRAVDLARIATCDTVEQKERRKAELALARMIRKYGLAPERVASHAAKVAERYPDPFTTGPFVTVPDEPESENVIQMKDWAQRPASASPLVKEFADKDFEVGELYQSRTLEIAHALLKIINDPESTASSKIAAIKEWNDRAFGKAPQSVKITNVKKTEETLDASKLSTATLEEIAKASRGAK